MQITDALLGEHGLFRNLLQTVERLRSESHDLTELRTAAAVLDNALATHSDIEETIFFPALEPHIGDTGPLAVMRAEHEELDRYVSEMRDSEDVDYVKTVLRDLVALARAHFQKEEAILFPLAGEVLDEAELQDLGKKWAAVRAVEIS